MIVFPKISGCDKNKIGDFNDYSAIINVTDSPYYLFESPVPYYWFPIHETNQFGYAPFYGAAKVWDQYKKSNKPVLFHCSAGVNRSVSVCYAVLRSDGITDKELDLLYPTKYIQSTYNLNIKKGFVFEDTIKFLVARHEFPTYSIGGLLISIQSPNCYYKRNEKESI